MQIKKIIVLRILLLSCVKFLFKETEYLTRAFHLMLEIYSHLLKNYLVYFNIILKRGKAVPLQAWSGWPRDFQKVKVPRLNNIILTNLITVQQNATYSVYYIYVDSSTRFGC